MNLIDRKNRIKIIIKTIRQEMKQLDKAMRNTWDYPLMVKITNRYNLLKKRKDKLK